MPRVSEGRQPVIAPSPTVVPVQAQTVTSLFIPYWNIPESLAGLDYNRYIYFGVTGTAEGINKSDTGYGNLALFADRIEGSDAYLTLRLLDTETNLKILQNGASQDSIIKDTLQAARDYRFKGIVLDLELSALPFTNIQELVNAFTSKLYRSAKSDGLKLAVALYGDTFYRKRPYDVAYIGKNSDEILIMAYDFHKPFGEPGPNFPLDGANVYGYDFKHMISDYRASIPRDKITVIFGYYGYDWTVDEKKRPLKKAVALTYSQISGNFISSCSWQTCLVLPDAVSGETEINYGDSTSSQYAVNHIIWFEDERSAGLKKAYLKRQGIGSTAYWVYGYF